MNNTYYVEGKMDKNEKVRILGELRKINKGNCKVGIYRKRAEEEMDKVCTRLGSSFWNHVVLLLSEA